MKLCTDQLFLWVDLCTQASAVGAFSFGFGFEVGGSGSTSGAGGLFWDRRCPRKYFWGQGIFWDIFWDIWFIFRDSIFWDRRM
jgi:hypothetical protein